MVKERIFSMKNAVSTFAFIAAIGIVVAIVGCTEDDPGPASDTEPPQVEVLYPPNRIDNEWIVSDSTFVYVAATDPSGIAEVEVWFSRPADPEPTLIGTTSQTISLADVPDSVSQEITLPDGWSLYRLMWRTLNISSGRMPQVFAYAIDQAENRSRSEIVRVLVLNLGDDLGPPTPEFIINPSNGSVANQFAFDPSPTTDPIDPLNAVRCRWDFEGDGRWEIDWEDDVFADETVFWTYSIPSLYRPTLEVRNSYFEGTADTLRGLPVSSEAGDPCPPDGMNFVEIPAGNYPRGASPLDEVADLDENPLHEVRLTNNYFIQDREVTNLQYLEYLSVVLDTSEVSFEANEVRAILPTAPADSGALYFDLDNSRVFFNVDTDQFEIEPGYEDHPVTGVTWFGANAFAFEFGLRLPTEAEWEVAARGDSVFYRYPYGREITDGDPTGMKRTNYVNSGDPFEGDRGTTPVGYYDGGTHNGFETIDTPSPFGLYDVSGNAAEWTNDWYGPYSTQPLQTNPGGPPEGVYKVVRGGNYLDSPVSVRVTARDADRTPGTSFEGIGFRTAYIEFEEPDCP